MSSAETEETVPGGAGMMGKAARGAATWGSLALIAVSVAVVALVNVGAGGVVGVDAAFPTAAAAVTLALGVYNLVADSIEYVKHRHTRPAASAADFEIEGAHGHGVWWRQVLSVAAILILAMVLTSLLGFFITALLICVSVPLVAGARPWWKVAVFAVLVTSAVYVLFELVLNVPFPTTGWLI